MSDAPLTLAFDTSSAQCSAALLRGSKILASRAEPMATGQAERLFGILENVLRDGKQNWANLSCIAVTTGPGNFTGVRIAVSAARGLALSLGIPAVGVSVLEALAIGVKGPALISLDARRDRLFAQSFQDGKPTGEAELVAFDTLAARAFTPDTSCLGYLSGEIAKQTGALPGNTQTLVDPVQIALCALAGNTSGEPRPIPVYLREPDAALPADPPPVILNDA